MTDSSKPPPLCNLGVNGQLLANERLGVASPFACPNFDECVHATPKNEPARQSCQTLGAGETSRSPKM